MDANELDALRDDLETLMPGTCTILTQSTTSDGYGGYITTWGTASSGVKCRLDPLTGRENVAAGAIQSLHRYMLTLPHDATITLTGRVVVSSVTYNVISVDTNKSWMASTRVIVERA